jgi:hypothetical protein
VPKGQRSLALAANTALQDFKAGDGRSELELGIAKGILRENLLRDFLVIFSSRIYEFLVDLSYMYIVDLTAKNGISWCHDLVKPLSIVLGWLFCWVCHITISFLYIYIDR